MRISWWVLAPVLFLIGLAIVAPDSDAGRAVNQMIYDVRLAVSVE